jgi:hypothetical protein
LTPVAFGWDWQCETFTDGRVPHRWHLAAALDLLVDAHLATGDLKWATGHALVLTFDGRHRDAAGRAVISDNGLRVGEIQSYQQLAVIS